MSYENGERHFGEQDQDKQEKNEQPEVKSSQEIDKIIQRLEETLSELAAAANTVQPGTSEAKDLMRRVNSEVIDRTKKEVLEPLYGESELRGVFISYRHSGNRPFVLRLTQALRRLGIANNFEVKQDDSFARSAGSPKKEGTRGMDWQPQAKEKGIGASSHVLLVLTPHEAHGLGAMEPEINYALDREKKGDAPGKDAKLVVPLFLGKRNDIQQTREILRANGWGDIVDLMGTEIDTKREIDDDALAVYLKEMLEYSGRKKMGLVTQEEEYTWVSRKGELEAKLYKSAASEPENAKEVRNVAAEALAEEIVAMFGGLRDRIKLSKTQTSELNDILKGLDEGGIQKLRENLETNLMRIYRRMSGTRSFEYSEFVREVLADIKSKVTAIGGEGPNTQEKRKK